MSDWASNAASATRPIGLASRIFLAKPRMNRATPEANFSQVWRPAHELVGHRVVADDRPGDELREERDVAGEVGERPDGRRRAAVDVDGVAERVERVERDPDRQGDRQHLHRVGPEPAQHVVQVRLEEHEVLEEPERAQADDDGASSRPSTAAAGRRPAGR